MCIVWRVLCLCVFLGWTYFDLQHWRRRDGVAGPEVYLSAAQYRLPARHPVHYPYATFVPAYCRTAQTGRKHGPPNCSLSPISKPPCYTPHPLRLHYIQTKSVQLQVLPIFETIIHGSFFLNANWQCSALDAGWMYHLPMHHVLTAFASVHSVLSLGCLCIYIYTYICTGCGCVTLWWVCNKVCSVVCLCQLTILRY